MTINRNNFEAYLLDYLEGNLDPLLTADLMVFLAENPEYEKYIEDYRNTDIPEEKMEFPYKNSLKKEFANVSHITNENFEEFCIAASENILSPSETQKLHSFIGEDADRKKTLEVYKTLKLRPDVRIQFNGRDKLKKKSLVIQPKRYLLYALSVAAAITIIVFVTINEKTRSDHQITSFQAPAINRVTEPVPDSFDSDTTDTDHKIPEEPAPVNVSHDASVETFPNKTRYETPLDPLEPILETRLENKLASAITRLPVQKKSDNRKTGVMPETFTDSPESLLAGLISKVDFWKTAETAINGFNYLTESQLSVIKTTDDSGRTTGLLVNTESYSIAGNKLK